MLPRLVSAAMVCGGLGAPVAAQMTFTDVTVARGLELELTPPASGTAVGDIDGDGWLDIALFGAPGGGQPRIYWNNGAGVTAGTDLRWFHDVTDKVMPEDTSPSSMGMFVDFDNDGDDDLVMVRRYYEPLAGEPDPFDTGLEYYENKKGRFKKKTADPFQGRAARRHGGLSVADTDLDGDLDIVFVHNGSPTTLVGGPGFYVRNDGFPRLVDVTDTFGADIGGDNRYFSAVLADFDGDMLPDLHVAVDFYPDFHCRNVGGGLFQDVSLAAGTTNTGADMGLAVGDIENDGDLDIYSTNINVGVLYVNDGSGVFTNEAFLRGVGGWGPDTTIGWGTSFSDFDHDRDQDLVFVSYGVGKGHLYENDATGNFTDVTATSQLDLRGHGLISFDYDRDGDLDLLVTRALGLTLFENPASDDPTTHWLAVELEGTTSNRPAIGTKVEVTTPDGTTQTRVVKTGESYLNGTPLGLHFGLGDTDQVTQLVVTWPNGQVDTLGPLTGDTYLKIVE